MINTLAQKEKLNGIELKKRKHQIDFDQITDSIIAGALTREILGKITPGGGKSMLPIIAGKLIKASLADALCWVVPRQSLQYQGEHNFLDPIFRTMFSHNMVIRSSTNDENPCRGLTGFITTYQAIGVGGGHYTVSHVFKQKRMVLVLDEPHHVEENGIWHKALQPIVDNAAYLVLMTGTLERGDGKRIAFISYDKEGKVLKPRLQANETRAVIEYSRRDALAEKAIIPLRFHLSDGNAEWIDKDGVKRASGISKAPKNISSQALFTAISTGFADELLETALVHWQKIKKYNTMAKLLVVTANYELASKTARKLKSMGLNSEIATSHESEQAQKAIKHFKAGTIDILVTIAIAYEGLDVPDITHIACLTNIRSTPWIEQMVARAVRPQRGIPYGSQVGYIFAPDDVFFREIVKKIEKEQLPFVKPPGIERQASLFNDEIVGNIEILPLSSSLNGHREVFLGNSESIPETPTEIESSLRTLIENHVRLYSFNNRHRNGKLNAEIKARFGKPRSDMTIPELRRVCEWIQKTYPLDYIRGTGRQRVPTKAVRIL